MLREQPGVASSTAPEPAVLSAPEQAEQRSGGEVSSSAPSPRGSLRTEARQEQAAVSDKLIDVFSVQATL